MTYNPDNIFAKILRGEAPACKVYEDEYSLAFMDVMPQIDGHTLVVPKCDAQDLLDVDPQVLAETIKTVQRLAVAVKAAFAAPGIMVAQLNGPAAGQTVFHLHFHIMPRHDGIALGMHAREMQDPGILEQHAQRIREQLATHE